MSQATLDPQTQARLRRRRIIISVIVVSIAVHFIGAILAGIWIVARFILATPTTFEVKKQIRIAAEEREHRMNMAEFDAARPKPSFTDKMSTARPTEFSLPDLPTLPIDTAVDIDPSDIVSDQLAALAGAGAGSGSGSGGGGKGGSAVSFFGVSDMATRVAIVMDVSDTMFDRQPGKFDAVKQEASKLVQGLGINTLFNIIIYEGGSVAMFPDMQPATDANKQKAAAWIQSVDGGSDKPGMTYKRAYSKMGTGLYEGGGTRTDTALKQALAMRPSTIFLITDGEMSRRGGPGGDQKDDKKDDQSGDIDERELLSIVGEGQKPLETPARIHVIHFLTKAARDEEEKTLRSVARRNDGRFRQVKAEDY
jgi:hypothetical protein